MSHRDFTVQEWPLIPLKDVATLQRGYDLPVHSRSIGSYPVIAANGPHGFHSEAMCRGPGVVTGRSGTIGNVHFIEQDYWPLNTALFVKDFHGNHPKWVFYMLKAFHLERFSEGSGVPTLNRNLVHGELVRLPPLIDQRCIATILDKANAIRKKRRKSLKLADEFLRSVFLDMFGDPVRNPKGWKIELFGDLVENLDGKRVPLSSSERSTQKGLFPYYGASGIIDWIDGYLFDESCLLISEDGANLLARSTPIAFIATGKYWVNNHAHVLRENGKAMLDYLKFSINLRSIDDFVTGSAQPKLNQSNLNRIPIPTPPVTLQKKFGNIVKQNIIMAERQKNFLEEAETIFKSISNQAFSL